MALKLNLYTGFLVGYLVTLLGFTAKDVVMQGISITSTLGDPYYHFSPIIIGCFFSAFVWKLLAEKKAVSEAMEKYNLIIEQSPSVYELYDIDGLQVEVNKAYEDLWQFPEGRERTLRKFNVLKSKEVEGTGLMAYVKKAYAGELVTLPPYKFDPTGESEAKGAGRVRWLSTKIYPIKKKEIVTNIVIRHEDITKRKQAEIELERNQYYLSKAQELGQIGTWELDILNNELVWTDENCRIFGMPLGSIVTYQVFISKVHPDDRDYVNREWQAATKGKPYDIEHRILIDGKTRWVREKADLTYDEQGNAISAIGFTQDVTDRILAERDREALESQLYQSQKFESIGRLAGGVAHDYNNMLSVIIGNVELAMMKTKRSAPVEIHLEQILQAANRSADITRQLLAFARKQIIDPKIVDLNTVIENMLKMLRNLLGENISLSWHPKRNLWPVKIDPSQLDQLLANLCINARDAIADVGKMTIETDVVSFDEDYCKNHIGFIPGDYTMFAVSDNGCGMDRETMDTIFEPFFTTKKTGEGTGLGLATAYGIVKQSDGFINVYSEPGQGTTFKIYLPRCVEADAMELEESVNEVQMGQGETVLLVEDDAAIVEMASTILEDLGYRILAANSPEEAITLAEDRPDEVQLLLTDVVMPGMNGRDLAKQIRILNPGMKVLYMSGYTANVIAHHGVLDEDINFIQKPFSRGGLSLRIREVLGTNS